jgi:hypothetical protein
VIDRRLALELGPAFLGIRVAHTAHEHLADRTPVGRDGIDQRDEVGYADDVDAAGIEVGCEHHAGQRGVAAVGAAHDADPLGVGDALFDQVLHAIGDVVLHGIPPLVVAGVEEGLAETGRAAEVRLQHGVAAVGQKLDLRAVAPGIAAQGPP